MGAPLKFSFPDGFSRIPRHAPTWFAASLLTLAALTLRWRLGMNNGYPTVDGVMYMEQARHLVRHGTVPFSCFPPGWPALIAAPLALGGDSSPHALLQAAHVGNALAGGLMALLTFIALRRRLGDLMALVSLVIVALLPDNLILGKSDLSEPTFACGLLMGWILYERGHKGASAWVLGLGYLIRPEAVLAGAGLWLHDLWRRRRPSWTMATGLAVPILPYLVFIRVAGGAWGLSSKDVALTQSLQAHPGLAYPGLILHNLGILFPLLAGILGLPLLLLALWGILRDRGPWLWMFAPLLPVPLIINPMVVRFWLPSVPFLLLAAGLGARDIVGRMPRRRVLAGAGLVLLTLIPVGMAARDDMLFVKHNTEAYVGLKEAGSWLGDHGGSGSLVAAYKPYASFWAGARFTKLPDLANPDALVTWVVNSGADYLVVNVLVAHTRRTGLDPLLQDPLPPRMAKKLELVRLFTYDLVEHNTAIYRVRRDN